MTVDRVRLWEADGIDPTGGNYTKHWSFEWPDLNSYGPVPSDGTRLELDFAAEFPDGSGNAAGFYLGVTDPTRFHYLLDGGTFDSASPPAWYSETAGDYVGGFGTTASGWTSSGGGLQLEMLYYGTSGWTLLADTTEPISADTASDSDWWHTLTVAAPTITSITPAEGILGEAATITGTNLSTVTDVELTVGLTLASWTIISDTQIDITLSAVASSDAVSAATVSVANAVGGSATHNWSVLFPGTWNFGDDDNLPGPWINLGVGQYYYAEIRTDQGEEPLSARPWVAGEAGDMNGPSASHYNMDNSPTVASSAPRFNASQSLRFNYLDLDHAVVDFPDEVMPRVEYDPSWVDTATPNPDDAQPAGSIPVRVEYEAEHSTFNSQVQYKRRTVTQIAVRSDGSPDITAKESDPAFTQTWTERLVPDASVSITLTDGDDVTTPLDRRHDQLHFVPDAWPAASFLAALPVIATHPPTSPPPLTIGGPDSGYIVPPPSTGGVVSASVDEDLLDLIDVTGRSRFVVTNVLDHFAGGAGFADVDMIHYDSGTVHGVYHSYVEYAIRSDVPWPQVRLFYATPRARLLYRRGLSGWSVGSIRIR